MEDGRAGQAASPPPTAAAGGARRRVARREDFALEDVRAALPAAPTFRTGAVEQRLAAAYDFTPTARKLLGKFLERHREELGVRRAGPPGWATDPADPRLRGSRWERTG